MIAYPKALSIPEQPNRFVNCMHTPGVVTMTTELHIAGEFQSTGAFFDNKQEKVTCVVILIKVFILFNILVPLKSESQSGYGTFCFKQ